MPIIAPDDPPYAGAPAWLTGGCLCGTVRFRLAAAPRDAGWCHCRLCQLNSGSPAMAFAAIAQDDYRIEQGEGAIRSVLSSPRLERLFCGECGTPLLTREANGGGDANGGVGGGDYHFNLPTLDDPDAVTPQFHIYYASHIAWAPAADDLPRHAASRHGSDPAGA